MIVILIISLFFPSLYNTASQTVVDLKTQSFGTILLSFGVALKATSFTYGGYQQTINFGEEVEDPKKNIPRGIFIGILIIVTVYLLASLAYFKVIGFNELKHPAENSTPIAAIVGLFPPGQAGDKLSRDHA